MSKWINETDLLVNIVKKSRYTSKTIGEAIDESQSIEVVRCKDCKYQDKGENESESWNLCGFRPWLYIPTSDDHFCGYGERGEAG